MSTSTGSKCALPLDSDNYSKQVGSTLLRTLDLSISTYMCTVSSVHMRCCWCYWLSVMTDHSATTNSGLIAGTIVESKYDPCWPNPQKIATKGCIVLSASAGHGEFQKKRLHKSDPGKGVNLHIFKMAANETIENKWPTFMQFKYWTENWSKNPNYAMAFNMLLTRVMCKNKQMPLGPSTPRVLG